MRISQHYQVVQENRRWSTVTAGYLFSIDSPEHQEILAFHWHPDGNSPVRHPHLHIGAGAQSGFSPLQKAHVPTGQVMLQDVLLFAINDLGVEPIIDRDLAVRILSASNQP